MRFLTLTLFTFVLMVWAVRADASMASVAQESRATVKLQTSNHFTLQRVQEILAADIITLWEDSSFEDADTILVKGEKKGNKKDKGKGKGKDKDKDKDKDKKSPEDDDDDSGDNDDDGDDDDGDDD